MPAVFAVFGAVIMLLIMLFLSACRRIGALLTTNAELEKSKAVLTAAVQKLAGDGPVNVRFTDAQLVMFANHVRNTVLQIYSSETTPQVH